MCDRGSCPEVLENRLSGSVHSANGVVVMASHLSFLEIAMEWDTQLRMYFLASIRRRPSVNWPKIRDMTVWPVAPVFIHQRSICWIIIRF